jgi:hypothetical protein
VTDPQSNLLGREPAIRMYVFLCLVALTVVVLLLMQRQYGTWSVFPGVIGLLAVVFRWRSGPLLFLAALTGFVLVQHVVIRNTAWRLLPRRTAPLSDWILCGACLAFVMAQYRLQGLVNFIFPPDPRTRSRTAPKPSPPAAPPPRRAGDLVTPAETGLFLLALPLWSALAQFSWGALAPNAHVLGVAPALDQLVLLTWFLGGGLLLATGLLGYLEYRRFTAPEATLFVQDTLWHETRREQRRVGRWLAWKRIQGARRKENP